MTEKPPGPIQHDQLRFWTAFKKYLADQETVIRLKKSPVTGWLSLLSDRIPHRVQGRDLELNTGRVDPQNRAGLVLDSKQATARRCRN